MIDWPSIIDQWLMIIVNDRLTNEHDRLTNWLMSINRNWAPRTCALCNIHVGIKHRTHLPPSIFPWFLPPWEAVEVRVTKRQSAKHRRILSQRHRRSFANPRIGLTSLRTTWWKPNPQLLLRRHGLTLRKTGDMETWIRLKKSSVSATEKWHFVLGNAPSVMLGTLVAMFGLGSGFTPSGFLCAKFVRLICKSGNPTCGWIPLFRFDCRADSFFHCNVQLISWLTFSVRLSDWQLLPLQCTVDCNVQWQAQWHNDCEGQTNESLYIHMYIWGLLFCSF
jgi:hypothetical protein